MSQIVSICKKESSENFYNLIASCTIKRFIIHNSKKLCGYSELLLNQKPFRMWNSLDYFLTLFCGITKKDDVIDGLIFCYSGHGEQNSIVCSNNRKLP